MSDSKTVLNDEKNLAFTEIKNLVKIISENEFKDPEIIEDILMLHQSALKYFILSEVNDLLNSENTNNAGATRPTKGRPKKG